MNDSPDLRAPYSTNQLHPTYAPYLFNKVVFPPIVERRDDFAYGAQGRPDDATSSNLQQAPAAAEESRDEVIRGGPGATKGNDSRR